jgi:hypothetical protein
MDKDEIVAAVREETADTVAPYLWSEAVILRYLDQGEKEFCRYTGVLIDGGIRFSTKSGKSSYQITGFTGDKILRVLGVKAGDTILTRMRGSPLKAFWDTNTSEPKYFSTHYNMKDIVLYPVPDDVYSMTVLASVSPDGTILQNNGPYIPEEYHEVLVYYAAYKCLITNDADGNNVGTAEQFKDLWYEELREIKRSFYRGRAGDIVTTTKWT